MRKSYANKEINQTVDDEQKSDDDGDAIEIILVGIVWKFLLFCVILFWFYLLFGVYLLKFGNQRWMSENVRWTAMFGEWKVWIGQDKSEEKEGIVNSLKIWKVLAVYVYVWFVGVHIFNNNFSFVLF